MCSYWEAFVYSYYVLVLYPQATRGGNWSVLAGPHLLADIHVILLN